MSIIWKYLLKGFAEIFFLCITTTVLILLIVRFQKIASFAITGAKPLQVCLFSLYQIPHILQIAIPISCLIATMVLFQRLSSHSEVTALRASGLSLWKLSYPFILIGALLTTVNFFIASELAPLTPTAVKNLFSKVASDNPLIFMQKESHSLSHSLLPIDNPHFDVKNLIPGKKAEEVMCVILNEAHNRIGIFTAKELSLDPSKISGKNLSLISSEDSNHLNNDHFILKNQKNMQMEKLAAISHITNSKWLSKDDFLSIKKIIVGHLFSKKNFLTSKIGIELLRRAYLGVLPLTCTIIGIAFGIQVSKVKKKRRVFFASFLPFCLLAFFISAKTLYSTPFLAIAFYLIPQPIALLISLHFLRRTSKGVITC